MPGQIIGTVNVQVGQQPNPRVSTISYGGIGAADNVARDLANSAIVLAQDAYNYANTLGGATATDQTARNLANNAYSHGQAAFVKANSAYLEAVTAYNTADVAKTDAISAGNLAQAAFNRANVASSTAAGVNYEVMYNNHGNFAGSNNFTFDYSTNILHVTQVDAVIDAGSF
jgi:hypothetical protein